MPKNYTMDTIVSLAKSRGFVYPGSEIYGGLANTWDYGNLGVELKNNVKRAWWKKFIQESKYNVGIDCAILMNPQTWVASGHLASFSDPLMDGIGQIGKSFRNEITPGNFTFRTREFEQMELEFFCKPDTDLEWFAYWKQFCLDWLLSLGIPKDMLRARDHSPEELCFYSKATTDLEFTFPFGWGELWGIADRTDYDLGQHEKTSGQDMTYFDEETNTHYIPYVIEPSLGADRVTLAFLCAAYDVEELEGGDERTVLRFHPAIAPVKVGILPLSKKLAEPAQAIHDELAKYWNVEYDDRGNIGKRYRRQDEIGTPYCVTYDFDSENDHCVTIRERDSMAQERVPIDQLKSYFEEKLAF